MSRRTPEPTPFADRAAAGRALARRLAAGPDAGEDPVVLALPRGGVPVAVEVARALDAPLDVLLVRKLGVPGQEELAFGALASGGVRVLNADVVHGAGLSERQITAVARQEAVELRRRERRYRGDRAMVGVEGRTAIVVDDGLATGATMRAAVAALRAQGAGRIVVAVPVGSPPACERVAQVADAVVCCHEPAVFRAVGAWYDDFSPVADETVGELLLGHPPTLADGRSSGRAVPPTQGA